MWGSAGDIIYPYHIYYNKRRFILQLYLFSLCILPSKLPTFSNLTFFFHPVCRFLDTPYWRGSINRALSDAVFFSSISFRAVHRLGHGRNRLYGAVEIDPEKRCAADGFIARYAVAFDALAGMAGRAYRRGGHRAFPACRERRVSFYNARGIRHPFFRHAAAR